MSNTNIILLQIPFAIFLILSSAVIAFYQLELALQNRMLHAINFILISILLSYSIFSNTMYTLEVHFTLLLLSVASSFMIIYKEFQVEKMNKNVDPKMKLRKYFGMLSITNVAVLIALFLIQMKIGKEGSERLTSQSIATLQEIDAKSLIQKVQNRKLKMAKCVEENCYQKIFETEFFQYVENYTPEQVQSLYLNHLAELNLVDSSNEQLLKDYSNQMYDYYSSYKTV